MWERYNNMGQNAMSQGKQADAEGQFRLAVKEAEDISAKDPKDPKLAKSLNDLANCLRQQGKFPEAEEHYKRALEVKQKAVGPLHKDLIGIYDNYAKLLRATGREAEAKKMEQHAQAIFAKN
ncbi:MAG: tetratricopeptide repeat protein [Cyanobacteria bacterium SZAS LIN-2]|nr:tetratricopeptide repeat protein [Cyanobacteria bacterium SZAS LIN-3]MBS1994850.1 tetratricopeptide repeat protein [Cyanobacteria bacterium SZAS LIN-2]MBS2010114.1 tetratricopeptide repeat protein [Cyanobacteria bacterium SZAS TMP-1]